jgi:hypothetical protein
MTTNPTISLRPAVPGDAPGIGAVFDAAVRAGWTYLGERHCCIERSLAIFTAGSSVSRSARPA